MISKSYDEFAKPVAIAYIGNKPLKRDTVARSGAVWDGFGDVQTVDPRAASVLLRFKNVWCRAEDFKDVAERLKAEVAAAPDVVEPSGDQSGVSDEDDSQFDSERIEKIGAAIMSLDAGSKDHFYGNGSPKVGAVRAVMEDDFEEATKDEVAEAFARLNTGA